MPEQMMFTEEEFALLHECIETQKEKDKKYIEYSAKGTGNPILDSLMQVLNESGTGKEDIKNYRLKLSTRVEDSTILQGKLQLLKRHQRQQSVSPNTAAQA